MFQRLTLAIVASFIYGVAFAQLAQKIETQYVVPGAIIKDGKEIQGYIKRISPKSPWHFQGDIRFVDASTFENTAKLKLKHYEKLDAKDIEGYRYADTLVYESVRYADMSAVGTGMIAKRKFMRKIHDNKISLFLHFQSPPPVGEVSELERIAAECRANPELVFRLGNDGKLKLLTSLNVSKDLADCPTVVRKFENNEYKAVGDETSASKANKLLNKVVFREEVRLLVVEDYNNTCP